MNRLRTIRMTKAMKIQFARRFGARRCLTGTTGTPVELHVAPLGDSRRQRVGPRQQARRRSCRS